MAVRAAGAGEMVNGHGSKWLWNHGGHSDPRPLTISPARLRRA